MNNQTLSRAGKEAGLDIQYAMGIASGVPTTFLSVGPEMFTHPDDFVTALLNEANYLLSLENPPNVLTSSYGINEANVTQSMAKSELSLS